MSEQGPTVFNGRYELLRHLARGGMADVYLARDELLDRHVALKVLSPEFANDPSFVERFRREAQAAANLSNPNVVGIFDWGQERGTYYIVMEYVEGRSMADVMRSTGPLSPDRAAEIGADVATALSAAHKAGLVHRDVKMGNILVSDAGTVKVADFGIATALAAKTEGNLTQVGSVMGTATYFSPEQAQGKPLDGRSDLYSLGVVLYEMLTGKPPFQADTPVGVAVKHVQERAIPPSELGISVPASLEAITMKLLAKDPGRRYPTADDLRKDLRRYLSGAHSVPGKSAAAAAAGAAGIGAAPAMAPIPPVNPLAPPVADATTAMPTPATSAPVDATTAMPSAGGVAPGPDATTAIPAAAYQAPSAYSGSPGGPGSPPTAQTDPYYYEGPPDSDSWLRTGFLVVGLAALVGLLGFLLVAFFQTLGGDDGKASGDAELIDVPRVIEMTSVDARETLVEAGFTVNLELEANAEVPADIVFGQTPEAGSRAEKDSEVTIQVSLGEARTVPSVVGTLVDEATKILTDLGYIVKTETIVSDDDQGVVISQNPAVGAQVGEDNTVTLTVSGGPGEAIVPNVIRDQFDSAFQELIDAGFKPVRQNRESGTAGEGTVIETQPAGGTSLKKGEEVIVIVSSGLAQVSIPAVEGLLSNTAQNTIESANLKFVLNFEEVPAGSDDVGRVIRQSPSSGQLVNQGSTITLVIGEITATTTTSTTTTTTTAKPTTTTTTTTTTAAPTTTTAAPG